MGLRWRCHTLARVARGVCRGRAGRFGAILGAGAGRAYAGAVVCRMPSDSLSQTMPSKAPNRANVAIFPRQTMGIHQFLA